jgi:hypothetical protein
MKKIIFLIGFAGLVGCVSLSRGPASISEILNFQLYGTNPVPSADFDFELLKLESLPDQVAFEKHRSSEGQVESLISRWQQNLSSTLSRNPEGFHFEKNKVLIDVDRETVKNLEFVLSKLDQSESNPAVRSRQKLEAIDAFNEHFKDSMEVRIDVLTAPFSLIARIGNHTIPINDGKSVQISPSSFWQPRPQVSLWQGPGKLDFEKLNQEICTYHSAKTGFGVHAGFKVKCLDEKLKVKFGNEVYSGPFNSRIYNRLGYNVPGIHYVAALKVAYERRMLAEINSRKRKYFKFRVAGLPAYDMKRLALYDAFQFMTSAHLKDGSDVSAAEFKQRLVRQCEKAPCDFSDANINLAFEKEIAYVTFEPSTVTEGMGEELGPWNYSNLDHPQRTEVKSLLLLGAWTGNFDLRKDNNRLVWNRKTGEIQHFISDPGSGIGDPKGLIKSGSRISDMHWNMTMETALMDNEQQVPVVAVSKYNELEANEAFRRVSFQDGQWMVRQIASVSEDEISEALAASGLASAEFLLAREKLVSIQQNMIENFKLKGEFPMRFRPLQHKLQFDPNTQVVDVKLSNGRLVRLQNRGIRLVDGALQYPAGTEPGRKKRL